MSSSGTTDEAPSGDAPPSPDGPPAPRRPRPVFLLVGVGLAGILAVILFVGLGTSPGKAGAFPGSPVPTFTLHQVGHAGRTVGVPADGGGNGRPAILLFFASWCGPCQSEVPALAAAYDRQRADHSPLDRVAVIGVDDLDPNAAAFVRASHVTFPVGTDPTEAVSDGKFSFGTLPEAVFVDADGTIAKVHYGALSTATFVKWERKLLSRS